MVPGAGGVDVQLDQELDSLLEIQAKAVAIRGIKIVGHTGSTSTQTELQAQQLFVPGEAGLELLTWLRKSRHRWQSRGLVGIVFAGEEGGTFTRTLAPVLGSDYVFAGADGGRRVAGQITASEQLSSWPNGYPREGIRIFGVLGFPVAASLSPELFTGLFRHHKVDAVFGRFEVQDPRAAFRFLELAEVAGLSVTAPHKEHAYRFAQDNLAPGARRLGAVNTLGRDSQGTTWWGANTDVDGVRLALGLDAAGLPQSQTAVVLGAGGAARAVLGALTGPDCGRVIVLARRPKAALSLAREFGASVCVPEDLAGAAPDLLIHTTPAGSYAQPGAMALDVSVLKQLAQASPKCIVLDAIYSPRVTPLLGQAATFGLDARNGLDWFLGQALAQFERFTGYRACTDTARSLVEACLARPWIALIGLRASGKSTTGALLAERLGLPFVDLDHEIASAAGASSAGQLLERAGEPAFRTAEAAALKAVLARPMPGILATGGGVVESQACRALLRGAEVWCALITAEPAELERRMAGDATHRPQLASLGGAAEPREAGVSEAQIAWQRRGLALEGLADVSVDSKGRSPVEIAAVLERALPGRFSS
ncbi:MAG: shikimate dehydrogenase [Bacteroidia bacterium]